MIEDTKPDAQVTTEEQSKPTAFEQFSKTSTAGKLSGKLNQTTGFFKRKMGQLTNDIDLQVEGENQQLLGKMHSLVGSLREIRELSTKRVLKSANDSKTLLQKHAGQLADQAIELLEDVKKMFF